MSETLPSLAIVCFLGRSVFDTDTDDSGQDIEMGDTNLGAYQAAVSINSGKRK
jgi:hypothetical protein